jgi:hypothetical protein
MSQEAKESYGLERVQARTVASRLPRDSSRDNRTLPGFSFTVWRFRLVPHFRKNKIGPNSILWNGTLATCLRRSDNHVMADT